VRYDVRLRDPSGKPYKRTFRTKREAETFDARERADRSRGAWGTRERRTPPSARSPAIGWPPTQESASPDWRGMRASSEFTCCLLWNAGR
jgi:hypothetical protein